MKHINENGRSMVEMLGVLAIIGVLSVGGIAGYSKAMNKYKINKTTDQVSMLVANIRTLFSSQGNYVGLNNGAAVKFGVVPEDMYTAGSSGGRSLHNAFNGAVTIEASPARDGQADEAFIIEYAGLTSEACVTVATGDWGSGQGSGLIAITAGSAEDAEAGELTAVGNALDTISTSGSTGTAAIAIPGDANYPTPMTITNAVAACDGDGSTNVVAWKYY